MDKTLSGLMVYTKKMSAEMTKKTKRYMIQSVRVKYTSSTPVVQSIPSKLSAKP